MKNMYFVVNPCSGKLKIKPVLLDVIQIFNEAGYNVNIQTTQSRGHAIDLMAGLPECTDIVVVSGGDGTLNEVFTGLLKSGKKLPVGYIPAGSTNDFGSTFGISPDPKKAAKQIVKGTFPTLLLLEYLPQHPTIHLRVSKTLSDTLPMSWRE